jgi:hypothetical protein
LLTNSTQIEFTRLELNRDKDFYHFCLAKHEQVKQLYSGLTYDLLSSLPVELAPGITYAKLLLEAYID